MLMAGISPSLAAVQDDSARINPATVAVRGKLSALLTLKAFGRYVIMASSPQGAALMALALPKSAYTSTSTHVTLSPASSPSRRQRSS